MRAGRLRSVLACAAVILFAACGSREGRVASGLSRGAAFAAAADWDKAGVEVRNVLQVDPKNAQAYFLGGEVAEGQRDAQRAFGMYLKAVELDPTQLEAKVGLARIYLLSGQADKAQVSVDDVLRIDHEHLGAKTLQAALRAGRGDLEGAASDAKALIAGQRAPPVEASMLIAGIYTQQGNSAAALAAIEAALLGHPHNSGLLQVAAGIASTTAGRDKAAALKAEDYFRRATELTPKNIELWKAWAMFHVGLGELDRAEDVLRRSIGAQPDDDQRRIALLDFLAERRGADVAEREFLAVLADRPKDTTLRFALVDFYRKTNRATDARRVLEELVAADKGSPTEVVARDQLAAEMLQRGQIGEARRMVAQVLKINPRDGEALTMRGRMDLVDGDARAAILDFRSVLRDQPSSPEVVGLLARAHHVAGEPQLAREVIADAVQLKPNSVDLRLLLAADLADGKEYRDALSEIDAALKAAPRDLRPWDMKAKVALAQGDVSTAEKVYSTLKASFPTEPAGPLMLGGLYSEQKKFDAALREYDAASRLAPDAVEPAVRAVGVLISQRRFDEADRRVDALARRDRTRALPWQLAGDIALARGDRPLAQISYQRAIDAAPTSTAGYLRLAQVRLDVNDVAGALQTLQEGQKAVPADTALAATRAEWLARAGRQAEAITVYETLLKRAPDDEGIANNLAYLLADHRDVRADLERALALTVRFKDSTNPGYLDSLGWVQYRLGHYDEAASVLERAVQRSPNSPLLQLHLGLALNRAGDTVRSQAYLKRVLASKAPLPDLDEARTLVR